MISTKRHFIFFSGILLILSIVTFERNALWYDWMELWGDSVKKSPHLIESHLYYGTGLKMAGYLDEAEKEYQIVASLDPQFAIAYYSLAMVYMGKGLLDEASEELNNAVKSKAQYAEKYDSGAILYLGPMLAPLYYEIAILYEEKGMLDKALQNYIAASEQDPSNHKLQLAVKNRIKIFADKYKR